MNHRHYWYGEHDDATDEGSGCVQTFDVAGMVGSCGGGGVGAWSTDDMISWRNEGIVLDYANLTDMVRGRSVAT